MPDTMPTIVPKTVGLNFIFLKRCKEMARSKPVESANVGQKVKGGLMKEIYHKMKGTGKVKSS